MIDYQSIIRGEAPPKLADTVSEAEIQKPQQQPQQPQQQPQQQSVASEQQLQGIIHC